MPETIIPHVLAVCDRQCCARAEDCEKDMCQDNCDMWLTPTAPRVMMVGLLAQPEEGLVRPDDVAELHFWMLANASSPWVIGREHESNNKNMVQILRGKHHSRRRRLFCTRQTLILHLL